MVLNILCNGVVSYRDEAQYCKSFIDDTFSKTCSVKLWPVLGFLNTQVEKKDTLFFKRCLMRRVSMQPKPHFPKTGTLFND